MKALLLNSKDQTVIEIEYSGDWRDINDLIGCQTFTCLRLENGDTVYVDDEALLSNPQHFFTIENYDTPVAGNALILGDDGQGGSCDVKSTQAEIALDVIFVPLWAVLKQFA